MKTRLVPPLTFDEAAMLYRAFLLDALDLYTALRPAVEPVLYLTNADDIEPAREMLGSDGMGDIDIRAQRGATLGERLEHAFDDAFNDGCDLACAIGTDHPTLPLGYVHQALEMTAEHDVAIGPADDGGYYLLALREPRFELLRDMPYSTPALFRATMNVVHERGLRVLVLPEWYDVDDARTLSRLLDDSQLLPADGRIRRAIMDIHISS